MNHFLLSGKLISDFDYLFLTCNNAVNFSFTLNQNIEEIRRLKRDQNKSIANIM